MTGTPPQDRARDAGRRDTRPPRRRPADAASLPAVDERRLPSPPRPLQSSPNVRRGAGAGARPDGPATHGGPHDWLTLGREQGLLIEAGTHGVVWLPAGDRLLHALEAFWRELTAAAGFARVRLGAGPALAGHGAVFAAGTRSWHELPWRLASLEWAPTAAGVSGGRDSLTCFAAPEHLPAVLAAAIRLADDAVAAFGFGPPRYRLAEAATGAADVWRQALAGLGRTAERDTRGAAAAGPTLTWEVRDARGRWWPVSRLALALAPVWSFAAATGRRAPASVVHGTLWGDWQRWLATVIEHGDGALPLWLAPEQLRILPVGPAGLAAGRRLAARAVARGVRTGLAVEGALAMRVKAAVLAKVPCLAVMGEREAAAGVVAVRRRAQSASVALPPAALLAMVRRDAGRHRIELALDSPG